MSTRIAPNASRGDDSALFLGIDIGTTHCKAALGSMDGRIEARAERPCRLTYPREGWVEANPDAGWWIPLRGCLADLAEATGGRSAAAGAIAVSCTNALVCVDRAGTPVRPAIMQIDRRSTAEAEALEVSPGTGPLFRTTANRIAPGTFSLPSLLWIRAHEPAAYRAIDTILSPAGYVVSRLTGRRVMDPTRAATTLLYDAGRDGWSTKIAGALEIDRRILPEILPSAAVAGPVTSEAARETGLRAGIPVAAGIMDSVAAAIGMGTLSPGDTGVILGTVGRVLRPLGGHSFDDRFLNVPLPARGRWIAIACANAVGLSVDWFLRATAAPGEPEAGGLARLDREAAESPAGARGLIYLPYLAGERSPIWNPRAKGVFFGLDTRHTRGDLGRALLEGTALAIRDSHSILESVAGPSRGAIRISGGGARSPIWPGIVASVLGRELRIEPEPDSECRGALMLAAAAARGETEPEWPEPPGKEPAEGRGEAPGDGLVTPDPRETTLYDDLFTRYRGLYHALRDRFDESPAPGAPAPAGKPEKEIDG